MGDRIKVIDKVSGAESFVPVDDFDPITQEVSEGQVATVAPLGGDEFAAGQEVTERFVSGDQLLPQFSPEARAELTAEQVEESTFDTTGNVVEQAARGALSGLTVGGSELLLRSDDPFERERTRRERAAAPTAFTVGQIGGSIAPALLSGGAGAAGTLARLTPTGRLAANSARFVSGSKGLASRALRSAAGAGLEGGVEQVGNTIANQAIEENPDLSAEAIASSFALGGVLGGGVGAASELLGAGLRRARRFRETPAEQIEREFADVPSSLTVSPDTAARAPAQALEPGAFRAPQTQDLGVLELTERGLPGQGFVTRPRAVLGTRPTVAVGDIVGKDARGQADDVYRSLATHIDDDGIKAFGAATQESARLTSQIDEIGLPDGLALELRTGLQETSNKYLDAGNRARSWLGDVAGEVGVPPSKLTAKQLDGISEDLEDRGIAAMAELDETGQAWNRASEDVQGGLAEAIEAGNRAAAGRPAGNISGRFREIAGRLRSGSAVGGATTAVGVLEGARELGVDVPVPSVRDIPVVGPALSLFTKMKALSRATGLVPATATTRSAQRVSTARDAVGSAIRSAGRAAARIAARPSVRKLSAKSARSAAREIAEIRNTTPADVEASAHASIDAPVAVKQAAVATAVRAHEYLSTVAPKNPLAGTAAESSWTPSEQQQLDWAQRRGAVRNPDRAIRQSMAGGFPDLAVEALREVYPALYEHTRIRIEQDKAKMQKRLPEWQLQSIGRVYRIPMTLAQVPGYGAAAQASFAQGRAEDEQAKEQFAARKGPVRALNPSTSPVGELQMSPLAAQV